MTTRQQQYERARRVMPGGVNSSTRLNKALGTPFFASRAEGSHVWDIEGRPFLDLRLFLRTSLCTSLTFTSLLLKTGRLS